MRSSGILLHITSLPSPYGIGALGREAYRFVHFLSAAGQRYWQVLPLNPTDYGNSPYQSTSVFAGNPYFIDLDFLCKEQLLTKEECEAPFWGESPARVDYEAVKASRLPLLRQAYQRFESLLPQQPSQQKALRRFLRQNRFWLEDYALYMALKDAFEQQPWSSWPKEIRRREPKAVIYYKNILKEAMDFYIFVQFKFYEQWGALKRYANRKGVELIGDIPIYVAPDSADTWAHTPLFQCDRDGRLCAVAGVPPDAFSKTGQMWGNPLYRWDAIKAQGYHWWVQRVYQNSRLFDVMRVDHFRGLESYYSIPAGEPTAKNGHWEKGPGMVFFRAIKNSLGPVQFIAEDLGMLTPAVHRLREKAGFPGMKILQFAFSTQEESTYLPHNCQRDCVVYTGTHDNNTICGWFHTIDPEDKAFASKYLNLPKACPEQAVSWALVRAAWATPANLAIAQMQDLLSLGEEARMNTPATVGANWAWRMEQQPPAAAAAQLRELTETYKRAALKQNQE